MKDLLFRHKYNKVVLLSSISTVLIAFLLVNALKLGFISFVVSSLLGNLFGLLLCYFLVRKNIQQEERPYNLPLICPPSSFGDAKARIKRICRSIKYGYKIAFSNIVASLNYRIDILLISYFLGVQAVGIYVVAVQIAEKLWFFSQSASTVLLPKLAAFYKSENEQMSEKAPTLTVFGLTSLFTLLSAMVTAFLSPRFIPLLFGADFDLSATVLFFLLPGVVFLSASRIFANDIAARGHPELNLYSSVLVLFSNAALNVLLIGKYGVIGAAVATSVAYAMNALFKTYTYLNYSAWFERSA
ncbi:MAG: lipid II flippase MurJ [Cyanobacteria bacterium J06560_5]